MWLIKARIPIVCTQGKISFEKKKKKEKVLCLALINLIFTTSLEK